MLGHGKGLAVSGLKLVVFAMGEMLCAGVDPKSDLNGRLRRCWSGMRWLGARCHGGQDGRSEAIAPLTHRVYPPAPERQDISRRS